MRVMATTVDVPKPIALIPLQKDVQSLLVAPYVPGHEIPIAGLFPYFRIVWLHTGERPEKAALYANHPAKL